MSGLPRARRCFARPSPPIRPENRHAPEPLVERRSARALQSVRPAVQPVVRSAPRRPPPRRARRAGPRRAGRRSAGRNGPGSGEAQRPPDPRLGRPVQLRVGAARHDGARHARDRERRRRRAARLAHRRPVRVRAAPSVDGGPAEHSNRCRGCRPHRPHAAAGREGDARDPRRHDEAADRQLLQALPRLLQRPGEEPALHPLLGRRREGQAGAGARRARRPEAGRGGRTRARRPRRRGGAPPAADADPRQRPAREDRGRQLRALLRRDVPRREARPHLHAEEQRHGRPHDPGDPQQLLVHGGAAEDRRQDADAGGDQALEEPRDAQAGRVGGALRRAQDRLRGGARPRPPDQKVRAHLLERPDQLLPRARSRRRWSPRSRSTRSSSTSAA